MFFPLLTSYCTFVFIKCDRLIPFYILYINAKQFCVHTLLRTHYYYPICTHTILRPYTQPLSFSNFFFITLNYHSMLFTFSILVLIFHVEIFCFHVCHPPQLDGFFLLYLIFNIRFNFCITMLVYLNAVRPKHRPCLSLQRKIDMVFVPTNIVRSFFFTYFFKPAPIHSFMFIFTTRFFLITHYMYHT